MDNKKWWQKMTVLWHVTPCSLVDMCWGFRRNVASLLAQILHAPRSMHPVSLKLGATFQTRLRSLVQKINIFIITVESTSNMIGWERIYMAELHLFKNVGFCVADPKWNEELWQKYNCKSSSVCRPIPKTVNSRCCGMKAGRILNILT